MRKPNLYLNASVRMAITVVGSYGVWKTTGDRIEVLNLKKCLSKCNTELWSLTWEHLLPMLRYSVCFPVLQLCFKLFSHVSLYLSLAMGGKGGRSWIEEKHQSRSKLFKQFIFTNILYHSHLTTSPLLCSPCHWPKKKSLFPMHR